MNVNEAIDALLELASTVYSEDVLHQNSPEVNTECLKNAIENMLQTRNVPIDTKIHEQGHQATRCKVVLYAATSANVNHPQAFRTYPTWGSSLNPTIVEALCATMVVSPHFLPIKIGPRMRQQTFVGGPLGANNPTRAILNEASSTAGSDKRVAQILSIGSGLPHVLSLDSSAGQGMVDQLLKGIAADCETVAQELSKRLFNVDAYLRLNVDRGMENITMKDWDDLGSIESHTGVYIAKPVIIEAIDTSLRHLRERIGPLTLGQLNQSSNIKVMAKTAPAVTPYYIVQKRPWAAMISHLVKPLHSRQAIFPITGIGGCGKTQLVSYFLQEYSSLFEHTIYVDASSSSSIKADIQIWARSLGDGHDRDAWEDGVRVMSSVAEGKRWVLIFDNADDPTLDLVHFLPKNRGVTIIITSRNRDVGNLSTTFHLELGEMETEEAIEVLLQAARRQKPLPLEEMKSVQALTGELGCLAVALVQAGTYCYQMSSTINGVFQPYTFNQYLSLFSSHRVGLMKKVQPSPLDNYCRGAYTTLDLSFNLIPQKSRDFLHVISFWHHTDIPLDILASAAKQGFQGSFTLLPRPETHKRIVDTLTNILCLDGKWSELQVQDIVRNLRSFSLLSSTSINDSLFLRMHPLVQSWSRDLLETQASQSYIAMAIQVLVSCGGYDDFRLDHYLLSHVLGLLDQTNMQTLHANEAFSAGAYLKTQGQYRKAAELFETALKMMKSAGKEDSDEALVVKSYLSTTYLGDGRWDEAEKLEVEVLERRKKQLGNTNPDTLQAAGNLASVYYVQGRWEEAEKLEVEVSEQQAKVLGPEHLSTITSRSNLASIYSQQGRLDIAEEMYLEAVRLRCKLPGDEHPETLVIKGCLATTYRMQGKLTEAEKLQLDVVEKMASIIGSEHPDALHATDMLASIYYAQNRYEEAEIKQKEVLDRRRRISGPQHPDTLRLAERLIDTLQKQKKWSESEALGSSLLEQKTQLLGEKHPETLWIAAKLANAYHAQENWVKAENLQIDVLRKRREVLGEDHPDTLQATLDLACIYSAQKRWEESASLLVSIVQRTKKMEPNPPNIQDVIRLLITAYEKLEKQTEAQELRDLMKEQ